MNETDISIVIPARNEAASIGALVGRLVESHPTAEVLVVDDGSTDDTAQLARTAGARVITHPYPKGNGAAVKTGARAANGHVLVFMDGDGQHNPDDVSRLIARIHAGCDMAVGARDAVSQANLLRLTANSGYNTLATWMTGHRIEDLTSGFRAVRPARFREFLFMLPNGFSYPTTITMAFFRSGYTVEYVPISAARRTGKSHLSPLRDGLKFLLIIFRVCTLYSPLKLFFPVAMVQFVLGLGYYLFTYVAESRFTNMSALMLTSALTTFLIGLISEQITTLLFKHDETRSSE